MPEPQVMTVTGPMPASALGVVDAHDHLFLHTPALPGDEFQDLERSTAEAREGRGSGIGTIVDMTPIGLGRRPDLLRAVSEATGMPIIGATGYHRDAHYPPGHWVHETAVEQLADRVVRDLEVGMHPADWADPDAAPDVARAGVIKAGASYHHASDAELRRLEACAIGSLRGGVAILVHTEIGTFGHEIVDVLTGFGVAPGRIILAHLDRNPDAELHAEIAARGVYLEYDTMGRTKYRPDSELLDLVAAMVGAGHGGRLLFGQDIGRRSMLRAYGGGPGLRYLMETFVPRVRRRIGDDATDAILVANPARAFALERSA
ncbi:MAG TPA: aryldialkylphosphatase [Candidatus Limnocylindria bacterium]|nr:aryldialkylphosphatase [Candidatus Limnocylindria bacterium]